MSIWLSLMIGRRWRPQVYSVMKTRVVVTPRVQGYYREHCRPTGPFLQGAAAHRQGGHPLMTPPSPPPRSLKRAKFDNLALVPASLLPFKATWQQLANELPTGSTLI